MMMKIIITFQFTLISIAACLLVTGSAMAQHQMDVPLSRPGQPGQLSMEVIRGTIKVGGYEGEEVVIRYNNGGPVEEQDRQVEGLRRITGNSAGFEVSENDNVVRINRVTLQRDLQFDILVPYEFSLSLSLVHGDIILVENVNGEVEVNHVNGNIEMRNLEGSAVVNTVKGNIKATFRQAATDRPMAFSNVNGNIDVTLPAGLPFTTIARTELGDIYTDFDMDFEQNGETGAGSHISSWVRGDVNSGGPEYLFKTMKGNIYIRKE